MKHGFIKVAAATPRVTVADCKANGEEILKAIHEMEKEHVKLMVFPEFCITGYTCHDLFLQRCLLDSAWDELLHIAEETGETDALIFVGLPLRHRGKLYNVAAALRRRGSLPFHSGCCHQRVQAHGKLACRNRRAALHARAHVW